MVSSHETDESALSLCMVRLTLRKENTYTLIRGTDSIQCKLYTRYQNNHYIPVYCFKFLVWSQKQFNVNLMLHGVWYYIYIYYGFIYNDTQKWNRVLCFWQFLQYPKVVSGVNLTVVIVWIKLVKPRLG